MILILPTRFWDDNINFPEYKKNKSQRNETNIIRVKKDNFELS